jgi:hypothetical protein
MALHLDGPSKGFGNQISIQTVTIVKAAKALRRVYRVDTGGPVCQPRLSCRTLADI